MMMMGCSMNCPFRMTVRFPHTYRGTILYTILSCPTSFMEGTLTLKTSYRFEDECQGVRWDGEVKVINPIIVNNPPVSGMWYWLNSANHEGWDAHAWPQQRYAFDLEIVKNGSTYDGANDVNENFHCYGKEIYSIADGIVKEIDDSNEENNGIWGNPNFINPNAKKPNYVLIEHENGTAVSGYYHLKRDSIEVSSGDEPTAGTLIGRVGNSGGSEPHLHFGYVRNSTTGRPNLIPLAFNKLRTELGTIVDGTPGNGFYESSIK